MYNINSLIPKCEDNVPITQVNKFIPPHGSKTEEDSERFFQSSVYIKYHNKNILFRSYNRNWIEISYFDLSKKSVFTRNLSLERRYIKKIQSTFEIKTIVVLQKKKFLIIVSEEPKKIMIYSYENL